jgi:18S rRNA (guanine1575-N7)-methyltransferase
VREEGVAWEGRVWVAWGGARSRRVCCARAAVLDEAGHAWIGTDVAADMLSVALEREVEGDLLLEDMGQGLSFRPGTFDGAISVSAIQWLCYATEKAHNPWHRANRFFRALYRCLKRGARAAMQFYPERPEHVEMLTTAALRAGFVGGVVVDNPNSTKARKYYLVIDAGITAAREHEDPAAASSSSSSSAAAAAAGAAGGGGAKARRKEEEEDAEDEEEEDGEEEDGEEEEGEMEEERAGVTRVSLEEATAFAWSNATTMRKTERDRRKAKHAEREAIRTDSKARRDWILRKKESARKKGKHVTRDSKYSGRRRPGSLVR